jgi:RNA polymerase sigma factor (sigma-70 family)
VSAREEDEESRRLLTNLMGLGARIAHRIAASRGALYYVDDLCGVAWSGLARALSRHDPSLGPLAPYAAEWMAKEVVGAVEDELKRAAREPLAEDVASRTAHPVLRGEEIAGDAVHVLLSVYAGEELGSNGEAELLTREAFAALHREIRRLDADDQRLVALRYFEGHTWAEVGAALGIAKRTAQDWDVRIRDRLREALIAWETVRPLTRGSR